VLAAPDVHRCDWHNRSIDDGTQTPDDGMNLPAGQGELPFDGIPLHDMRVSRLVRLREARERAADTLRHRPLHAVAMVGAFTMRWALRIGLPMAGAAAMLHLFPYRATAGGIRFRVEGTLLTRSGLGADTTFGNWEFRHVDGLPIGAHISPENVDVVNLAAAASRDGRVYVEALRADLEHQVPRMIAWLAGEALLGGLLGLAVAAAINLAVRYARNAPHRPHELRRRALQTAAAFAVVVVVGGYGALTYNPNWARESRVTGTLGALQLFPGQLSQYYTHQSKVFDVISAIAGIQAQLQQHIQQSDSQPPAFNIMFVSDMHLASTYPLVQQYATNFGVSLIIDTGDESEFGTRAEMTPTYLAQLSSLTKQVPMIWMAGNHDSPATVDVMRSIPGVTVLGTKETQSDGAYSVVAQQLSIFGLTIAALPDPRVYGGPGAYGSNDDKVTYDLERRAADQAVRGVPKTQRFDIFASHEPGTVDRVLHDLPGQIRQTNAGHMHAQNPESDVQHKGVISLVEGTTGAGGLDNINGLENINRGGPAPPIEFSIESVAASCQFTKVVRFQLQGPPPGQGPAPQTGQQVTATTRYFDAQSTQGLRTCGVQLGRTPVQSLGLS
jgi:predicted MPP superfamily phosphohydrolase